MSKESIKIKLNKINFPGVYVQTGAQDSLEWIAMATVIIASICIFTSVIRYIVLHRSQQIDSIWPVVVSPAPYWTW
jgi:hypothetical protein